MSHDKKHKEPKINKMPGIILSHISKEENKKTEETQHNSGIQNQKRKKGVFYVLVFVVSAVVFIMWILNLNTLFFEVKNRPKEEKLFNIAKKEFDKTVGEVLVKEDNTGIINQIQNILTSFASSTASSSSTSTATSTDNLATSTEQNTIEKIETPNNENTNSTTVNILE